MSQTQTGGVEPLSNFAVIGHFDGDAARCFRCRAADAAEAERRWDRDMRRVRRENGFGRVDYYVDVILSSETAIEAHE